MVPVPAMGGLRQHVIILQPLWVVGRGSDRRFTVDYDLVDALPDEEQVEQLGYVLRKDMVAPPSNPSDFTQDRPEQTTKLYASLDDRILVSERRAMALGLSNFKYIARLFFLGGDDPAIEKLRPVPLIGPTGVVGERTVNGKTQTFGTEVIGGFLPTGAMRIGDGNWGNQSVPILPAPTGDLALAVQEGATAGSCITSIVVTRPSTGWNREIVNTRARGRQIQCAIFTREIDLESSYILNPTQGGSSYAEDYHGNHPKFGQTVKRIFWQCPPKALERTISVDQYGSTVFEILTVPIEFSPDYPEAGAEPGNESVTAGTEECVAAWTGLRYRDRHTFHYRGLPGVVRRDSFVECDFDMPAWDMGPGWPGFVQFFHFRHDEIDVNTEGYAFDAATETLTALHSSVPVLWPAPTPPNTNRRWHSNQNDIQESNVRVAPSPFPSGHGGIYLRSTGGDREDLCTGVYMSMHAQANVRSNLSHQQLIHNAELDTPEANSVWGLSANYEGHPIGGLRGSIGWLLGLKAGVHQFTCFLVIGTQAEVQANMRQLYLWGY